MECSTSCMHCLFNHQYDRMEKFHDADKKRDFLCRVSSRLGKISDTDTAPYLTSVFEQYYEDVFGERSSFTDIKKDFNAFVLEMLPDLRARVESDPDPLKRALIFSRLGNYIDYSCAAPAYFVQPSK